MQNPQQILKTLKLVKIGETRFSGALNGNEGEYLASSGWTVSPEVWRMMGSWTKPVCTEVLKCPSKWTATCLFMLHHTVGGKLRCSLFG